MLRCMSGVMKQLGDILEGKIEKTKDFVIIKDTKGAIRKANGSS